MNIAILDDSPADRRELRRMLEEYFLPCGVKAEITEFSGAAELLDAVTPGAFQIAFLDIYLDGENGMDAARIVCKADPECRLVFFTTSYDYAVDSYLVRAAYYLTKPVERERLADALAVCCRDADDRALEVTVERVPTRLFLKEIYFLDCESRVVRVHLEDRTLAVSESLAEMTLALLEDERFLACNRGVLVNMDQVSRVQEGDFLLKNGARVPIRVRGRGDVKKAYLSHSLKSLERRGGL